MSSPENPSSEATPGRRYSVRHTLFSPISSDINKFKGSIYQFPIKEKSTRFDQWMRNKIFYQLLGVDREHLDEDEFGTGPPEDNYFMTIAIAEDVGKKVLKTELEVIDANVKPAFKGDRPWKLYYFTSFLGEDADRPFFCAYSIPKRQLVIYLPREHNHDPGDDENVTPIDYDRLECSQSLRGLMEEGFIDEVPSRMWAHDWHMDRDKEHFQRLFGLLVKGLRDLCSEDLGGEMLRALPQDDDRTLRGFI